MLYNFYCLGKQQGHQKTITMVTNNSIILQELGKMSYFAKGQMCALNEQEEDCTHMVCSRLGLAGLCHIDERVQPECKKDYVTDPNT